MHDSQSLMRTKLQTVMSKYNTRQKKMHWVSRQTVAWPAATVTTAEKLPEYLELSGTCTIKMNEMDIVKGLLFSSDDPSKQNTLLDKHDTQIRVGAWFSGKSDMCLSTCKPDKSFEMKIRLDEHCNEVLKFATYLDTVDKESGIRKPYVLQTCGINLIHLNKQGFIETSKDEFNECLSVELKVQCNTPNIPVHLLPKSSLRFTAEYNSALERGSKELGLRIDKSNLRPPKSAGAFMNGLTFAPFLGMPSDGIPSLHSHYGLIGAHMNHLERVVPLAIPCYFFVTSLMQNVYTVDQFKQFMKLGCSSVEYTDMIADTISGFTKDAMCMTYQRDVTVGMSVADFPFNTHLELGLSTTEDMNIIFTTPSLACECDKKLTASDAPKVSKASTMADLRAAFAAKEYEELSRCIGKDDCETSAYAICNICTTIKKADWSVANIEKQLKKCKAFDGLDKDFFNVASCFFTDVKQLLISKDIQVSTVVGMAGEASAKDVDNKKSEQPENMDEMQGGGHCFGVMKVYDKSNQTIRNRILEGTNSTLMVHASQMTDFIYKSMDSKEMHTLDTCSFLCAASKTITALTQIGNSEVGGLKTPFGWKGPIVNASSTRSQMALNAQKPAFYKLCMYVGTSFEDDVYGHMPCSLNQFTDGKLACGCYPADLNKSDLQGINIDGGVISTEVFAKGDAILEEIFPPVAPESKFFEIMNTWATLPPLSSINQHQFQKKETKYICINSMESPASPHLCQLMYQAKRQLCELANEKNAKHPQSDGGYFMVNHIGTGVTISTCWPIPCTTCVTLVHSLKEAIDELKYNTIQMT